MKKTIILLFLLVATAQGQYPIWSGKNIQSNAGGYVFLDTVRFVKGIKFTDGFTGSPFLSRFAIYNTGPQLVLHSWSGVLIPEGSLQVGAGNAPTGMLGTNMLSIRSTNASVQLWTHPYQWNMGYISSDNVFKHWYSRNDPLNPNRVTSTMDTSGNLWQLGNISTSGNVSAPNGTISAKTVVGDSSAFRMIVRDSTGWIQGDTLRWRYRSYDVPSLGIGTTRSGSVDIDIQDWATTSGIIEFSFVADSANSVAMDFVEIELLAQRGITNYNEPSYRKYLVTPVSVSGVSATVIASGGAAHMSVTPHRTAINSRYQFRVRIVDAQGGTNHKCRIKASYQIGVGNTSSTPIKITEL